MPYRNPAPARTKVLRFCLDVLATPCPCPVAWEAMDGGDCQRSCPRCEAIVTDVAAMDPSEAEAFLEEKLDEPPFLRLFLREDGRVMEQACGPGVRRRRARQVGAVLAAALAIAIVVAARS